jgi:predicted nucleic acid-binding protein
VINNGSSTAVLTLVLTHKIFSVKKQTLLLLALGISCLGMAQEYFSSSLTSSTYVNKGGLITFDDRNLIIASEYSPGFLDIDSGYILEVESDGTMAYKTDLGGVRLFDESFTANDQRLTIAGEDDQGQLKLFQLNTALSVVQEKTYDLGVSGLWVFDIVEYAGYYVLAISNYGTAESNFPRLYWIDASDLSLVHVYVEEEHENAFRQLEVDSQNNLRVYYEKEGVPNILTFDANFQLTDQWSGLATGPISYLNFEVTQNDQFIFGLAANRYLQAYSKEGELQWGIDIASSFEVFDIEYIRQLKELENGDILLCGSLEKDFVYYGFIFLLSPNGLEKWKRMYSVENALEHRLKDFIPLPDNELLFYGSLRFEPFPSSTNAHDAHWVLKTDEIGCLGADCGEDVPVSTQQLNIPELLFYPNPVNDRLFWEYPDSWQSCSFQLLDPTGRIILAGVTSESSIDVSQISPGLYVLQMVVDGANRYTKKVIKIAGD